MNGILNLYKEAGFTSHDCVAKLRGIFKQKKIGHMGTLDPAAQGVLPVALGKATRLIELFNDDKKIYRATMLLGVTTDTLDTEGKILSKKEVNCSPFEATDAALSFIGDSMQIPPMYSAIKKDGKKLYELAREGIEVERKPRPITIFDLKIISVDMPEIVFDVTCSRGTYIRSLCDDIGRKLGCGACMKHLIRIQVGSFTSDKAYTLKALEDLAKKGELERAVLPITDLFPELLRIHTSKSGDILARNGNPLKKDMLTFDGNIDGRFWLFDSDSNPIGIYEYKKGSYYPVKMIYEA